MSGSSLPFQKSLLHAEDALINNAEVVFGIYISSPFHMHSKHNLHFQDYTEKQLPDTFVQWSKKDIFSPNEKENGSTEQDAFSGHFQRFVYHIKARDLSCLRSARNYKHLTLGRITRWVLKMPAEHFKQSSLRLLTQRSSSDLSNSGIFLEIVPIVHKLKILHLSIASQISQLCIGTFSGKHE